MDYEALNDDELMLCIQSNDNRAFSVMVERYQSKLQRYFYRKCRDRHSAEDLTQETFIRLYQRAWDFLPVGRFQGWLFRMAYHLLVDESRRTKGDSLTKSIRSSAMGEDDVIARMTSKMLGPEATVSGRELYDLILELLATIPLDQKTTFELFNFDELSLPDIADVMDINKLSTVKSRLRLSRQKLRTMLREKGIVLPFEYLIDTPDEDEPPEAPACCLK